MRIVVSLSAGLMVGMLGACATSDTSLSDRSPSLAVADVAMRNGSPAIALRICTDQLQSHSEDLAAQICQGDALAAMGQADAAEAAYARALQTNGHSTAAMVGLGRLRLSHDPAAAETLFSHAVDGDSGNATAWNNLGIARDLQGRHLQAQIAYRRALEITPSAEPVKVNLALSLAISGGGDEALQLMHSLGRDPATDPHLRANLAAVLAMSGRYDEAARLLAQDLPPDQVDRTLATYRDMMAHDQAARTKQDAAPALTLPTMAAPASATVAPATAGANSAGAAPPRQTPYVVPASAPWATGPGARLPADAAPAAAPPAPPKPAASATPSQTVASLAPRQPPYVVPTSAPWATGPRAKLPPMFSMAAGAPDQAAASRAPRQPPYVVPAMAPWATGPDAKLPRALASAAPPAAPLAEPAAKPAEQRMALRQPAYVVPALAPWETGPQVPAHPVAAHPRQRMSVPATIAAAPQATPVPAIKLATRGQALARLDFVPPSAVLPTSTSP